MMSGKFRVFTLAVIILIAASSVCGCGRGDNNPLTVPGNAPKDLAVTSGLDFSNTEGGHYLWGFYIVKIDTENLESEIIPVREISMHLNVLKFLEHDPCANCFKIGKIAPGLSGTLNIDISIKHPFQTPLLTGFDVRGIAMFNGSKIFPVSGLRMSDSTLGDGELINADGYTTLYNPSTIDHGPFEGFLKGKFATETAPNATLNGFKRFITNNPANTRNAFYAGDNITVTYQVKMPKPFIFGYAIDANWAPAIHKPVSSPMADFGLEANCPEPWKIEVGNLGPGLTDKGGTTTLHINVYDRGGPDSHKAPVVECPELFDGSIACEFESENPGYSVWRATISNDKLAAIGNYRCLVSVEDNENDPVGKPWTDLTAYLPVSVPVLTDGNLLWAKRAGGQNDEYMSAVAALSDDSFVVTGYFEGTSTFGECEPNQTILISVGSLDIFIARYNPDGTLAWAKRAGGPSPQRAQAIDALSDDSFVIAGHFSNYSVFGEGEPNQTTLTSIGLNDFFIARYNSDGTCAWAKRAGGEYFDFGYGITALPDNSTVVTGAFLESAIFGEGESNQRELVSAGSYDIFIARYNTDGTLVWADRAGGPGGDNSDFGYGVTALSDCSSVVTGNFSDEATFGEGESNETVLASAGFTDMFIARYNSDGTLAWAKRAGGLSDELGHAITALSDDSTVVTGWFGQTAVFGEGEPDQTALESTGEGDVFIARYNPDGTLAWAKSAGGPVIDVGYGLASYSDDSIAVTGQFFETAIFGGGEPNQTAVISAGNTDIFIARYNPDGTLAWAKSAGGSDADYGFGVGSLSDNSTVAAGWFKGAAVFGEGEPCQTVLISSGATDIFLARFLP